MATMSAIQKSISASGKRTITERALQMTRRKRIREEMLQTDQSGVASIPRAIPSSILTAIDGSYGEGGGQLIRNACAYAAIFQRDIQLINIRQGRNPKPGLQRQHLVSLQLLAEACGGSVRSVSASNEDVPVAIGSSEVLFQGSAASTKKSTTATSKTSCENERIQEIVGDTQTAGSICLLLQAVLPYAIFSGHDKTFQLTLKGGTNATMAPPIDYFQDVFLPTLLRCGKLPFDCIQSEVVTRGFFPRGGGTVRVRIQPIFSHNASTSHNPCRLHPIRLTERGAIVKLNIRAYSAGKCHQSVATKLASIAKAQLDQYFLETKNETTHTAPSISVDISHLVNSVGSGSGIMLVATTQSGCLLGASSIGSPKIPNTQTAQQAVSELIDVFRSGACVDDYLQDQLILYMALADGVSEIVSNGLTLHTQTAMWLAEQVCDGVQFEVIKMNAGTGEQAATHLTSSDLGSMKTSGASHKVGKIPGLHLIRCRGIGYACESMIARGPVV